VVIDPTGGLAPWVFLIGAIPGYPWIYLLCPEPENLVGGGSQEVGHLRKHLSILGKHRHKMRALDMSWAKRQFSTAESKLPQRTGFLRSVVTSRRGSSAGCSPTHTTNQTTPSLSLVNAARVRGWFGNRYGKAARCDRWLRFLQQIRTTSFFGNPEFSVEWWAYVFLFRSLGRPPGTVDAGAILFSGNLSQTGRTPVHRARDPSKQRPGQSLDFLMRTQIPGSSRPQKRQCFY